MGAGVGLASVFACVLGVASGEGLSWEDWDRRQVCHPRAYYAPRSEAELVAVVRDAYETGETVKVVGAGHSFSPIALTDGVMVSLDNMDRILAQDGTTVTVEGGVRLHALNAALEARGLSLENLGATCEQSLAGATATGTHGTGRVLGSMSTQLVKLRLVLANGTVVEADATHHADLFAAARVGLGALGVVSAITLEALPLVHLRLNHTIVPLDDLLRDLPGLMATYERLQWYWQPPDEARATLVTRELVPPPPASEAGCWTAETLLHGDPRAFFDLPPPTATSDSCTDVSYKALCGSAEHYAARKLYTEMEMFVPVAQVAAAIADFRAYIRATPMPSGADLLVGVRYVAADDITLSPQHGRDNAVISFINTGSKTETGDYDVFQQYASKLEDIASSKYHARPHWGKMNYATASYLETAYGADTIAAFKALRADLDPKGTFLNDYLEARLGL